MFNSLAERCGDNLKSMIFKPVLGTDILSTSGEIAHWWIQNLSDYKLILVQVMAWCQQATRPYLIQFWHRSLLQYGVTRPQWVNYIITEINHLHAKFFRRNIYMYLQFILFFHNEWTQIVEIVPHERQEPACSAQSISWLLMSWGCKESGHQQMWYRLWWTGIIWYHKTI